MTAREKAMLEWIAKVVMGLTTDGLPGSGWYRNSAGTQVRFRPHLSISDAMEALDKWVGDDGCWIVQKKDWHSPKTRYEASVLKGCGPWTSRSADTPLFATCEVLCAATGFQWEGKNEETR